MSNKTIRVYLSLTDEEYNNLLSKAEKEYCNLSVLIKDYSLGTEQCKCIKSIIVYVSKLPGGTIFKLNEIFEILKIDNSKLKEIGIILRENKFFQKIVSITNKGGTAKYMRNNEIL